MASPSHAPLSSLAKSWGGKLSPKAASAKVDTRRTETPPKPIQKKASSPPTSEMSVDKSPVRSPSPSRNRSPRRSQGKTSPRANAKDPHTDMVGTIGEMDARSTVVVGDRVWVADKSGDISIRNQDGQVVHIVEKRKGAFVWCFLLVQDRVWAGCSDGFIRVLHPSNFKMERQFARHAGGGGGVNCLAFHAPSNTVFSGSNDFEILSWDASTMEFLKQGPLHSAVRAIVTDTHCLYAGTDDGNVSALDVVTLDRKAVWGGHTRAVLTLCLTNSHLWSGSEDGTVRIWDAVAGEAVGVAEVHTGPVTKLRNVGGSRVWSAAGDTICVWDAEQLSLVGSYNSHDGYIDTISVVAKAGIYKVWTSGSDKQLRLWQSEEIPDETDVLRAKIIRLQQHEFDNCRLTERLAEREARLVALEFENARLAGLETENSRLQALLQERDAEKAQFDAELASKQAEVDASQQEAARLGALLAEALAAQERAETAAHTLTHGVARILATLQGALGEEGPGGLVETEAAAERAAVRLVEAEGVADGLRTAARRAEDELAEARHHASHLHAELAAQGVEMTRLQSELARYVAECEAMSLRLREMEVIFKSRLALITEVFRVYRKLEKARGDSEQVMGAIVDFKAVITTHYTDDELAHLGSSRHFFSPRKA